MIGSVRIVAWNANGLLQHRNEIQVFVELNKIDTCLISETHFTRESYLKIRGYNVYHTIHPQNVTRKGSAIIIKKNFLHNIKTKIETEQVQLMALKIKTRRHKIIVGAIYCPPRYNINKTEY